MLIWGDRGEAHHHRHQVHMAGLQSVQRAQHMLHGQNSSTAEVVR
jgi:hypothetical protein